VDEVAVHADPEPQRPEMTEDDLAFGRLAEQAHIGHAAVRDEVARPRRVTAERGPLRIAVLRLLDLAADRRDEQVAAQPHARLPLAHPLLVSGEAVDVDERRRRLDQARAVDLHPRTCGKTLSPNSWICSRRSSPHSSSMTCVHPASLYSSIAAMQSSGVPAIGRHLSRIASVTFDFAARRPPCSIASATGRISSCSSPARSSSVSAAPWMFCTLFARYMPAISRAPSRPASRSLSWIDATTVHPMSTSAFTFSRV